MITYDYFTPPSILSPHNLSDVLDLTKSWITNYEPLRHSKPFKARHCFLNTSPIYLLHPELRVVQKTFTPTGSADNHDLMRYLLAIQPNKETINQTQEFISELATNNALYKDITHLIQHQPIFKETTNSMHIGMSLTDTNIHLSPERAKEFLEIIMGFEKFKPKSKSMNSLFTWAQSVLDDKLYQELSREKENAKSSRIIAVAEPEFGDGLRYAKLKPGKKIEDFVDFFHPKIDHFVDTSLSRNDPRYGKKLFIEYLNDYARKLDEDIVLSSKQDLINVNNAITELLTTSLFAATTQINHALAGANFYRYLKKENLPVTFPEITNEENHVSAKSIYPIRMLLNSMNNSTETKNYLKSIGSYEEPLPIDFTINTNLTEIEGPNNNGKTELLRTIYLATHFANSGFPVPAKNYKTTLFQGAHFFKFKKTPGTGGSELERDIKSLIYELKNTYPSDFIFIDEFGDATNDDTSKELGRRMFSQLIDRKNTVFMTTHQKGLGDVIIEMQGKVYRPDISGKNPYQPIPAKGAIDYIPNKVLDKMNVTTTRIKNELPKIRPKDFSKSFYNEPKPEDGDEDLPF